MPELSADYNGGAMGNMNKIMHTFNNRTMSPLGGQPSIGVCPVDGLNVGQTFDPTLQALMFHSLTLAMGMTVTAIHHGINIIKNLPL